MLYNYRRTKMKYDFSIVINDGINNALTQLEEFFNKKRTSTIISKILNIMYPFLKNAYNFTKEEIPRYEKLSWNKKIHITIDYKIYLLLKKIYEDTNGYSMAFIIRRTLDFFIKNIKKHKSIDNFVFWLKKLIAKNGYIKKIEKKPFDVWKFMEDNQIKRLGRLIWDNEKREFPIKKQFFNVKYNEYFRPIGLSYQ